MESIDGIVYINLATRIDRKEEIEKQLQKVLNPEDLLKVHRLEAIRNLENPCLGCVQSHCAATQLALDNNWTTVLILEDDFVWEDFVTRELLQERLSSFWKNHMHAFGFVQVGHGRLYKSTPISDTLHFVENSCNAVAYIVHHRAMQPLIDIYTSTFKLFTDKSQHWLYQNDIVWNKIRDVHPCYAFEPRLAYQSGGFSDLSCCILEPR